MLACVCASVRVCVSACLRALELECVCACVRVFLSAYVRVCVSGCVRVGVCATV